MTIAYHFKLAASALLLQTDVKKTALNFDEEKGRQVAGQTE